MPFKLIFAIITITLLSILVKPGEVLHCNNRLSDKHNKVNYNDKDEICKVLSRKELVFFRLTDNIQGIQGKGDDYQYDNESEEFFNHHCMNHDECNMAIFVTVYFDARKIRITTGKDMTDFVKPKYKEQIIDNMKTYLKNNDFKGAFIYAGGEISNKIYQSYYNRQNNINDSESDSSFLFFIIFVIAFIGIFVVFIILAVSGPNIHAHFQYLQNLVNQKINKATPPIISVDECLISMEKLNELKDGKRKEITRFSCGHYYLTRVINSKILSCPMCNESTTIVNCEGNDFANIVDEGNIKNLLKNFELIYNKSDLKSYHASNQNDIKYMRESSPEITWINNSYYYERVETNSTWNSSTSNSKKTKTHTSGGDYDSGKSSHTTGGDY